MELTLIFFLYAIPAVIFAGISKAGFGSGASFVAAPLLALVIDPAFALGLLLPLFMLIDAVTLKPYWGKWDTSMVVPVILGGLPGVMLGAMFYQFTNADSLRVIIGVISLAFVLWQSLRALGWFPVEGRRYGPFVGALTGLAAGFTSFVSHAGGPPVAIYMLGQGVSKTTYQAGSVLIFWAINIFKAVPYGFLGIFTAQTLLADAILTPFALLGAWIGVKLHYLIPERPFFAVTYVMLLATGTKLLWDGLS